VYGLSGRASRVFLLYGNAGAYVWLGFEEKEEEEEVGWNGVHV